MNEHTILVAFTVEAETRKQAHESVQREMPKPSESQTITSWWVAEDDRHDRSDNDSAVFVTPGAAEAAFKVLLNAGLTEPHNRPAVPACPSWETPEQVQDARNVLAQALMFRMKWEANAREHGPDYVMDEETEKEFDYEWGQIGAMAVDALAALVSEKGVFA